MGALYLVVLNTAIEEAGKSTHHPHIGAVVIRSGKDNDGKNYD